MKKELNPETDQKLKKYFDNYIESVKVFEWIEKHGGSLCKVLNATHDVNAAIDILCAYLKSEYDIEEERANEIIINVCNSIEE